MTVAIGPSGHDAMVLLREILDDLGYAQLYSALAGGALFPPDPLRARVRAKAIGGEAGAVLGLFACDAGMALGAVTPRLRHLAGVLEAIGLAHGEGDRVRLDDLVVVPVLGGYLLTATPPGWRPGSTTKGRAYLGEDSLRLARALPPAAGKTVLDLGAGSGVQGLLGARGAAQVVLSDVEPRSLELASLNACLNRPTSQVEVVGGDCYEPVRDRRFDLIVTLAPYLPSLKGTDEVVAAGDDGLGLLRRIVAGAAGHLRPRGELVALGQLLCDDGGPLLRHELIELAPDLEARLVCFEPHALQPYALELATKLAPLVGEPPPDLHRHFVHSLRAVGATGVCTAFLRLRAPGPAVAAAAKGPEVHLDWSLGPAPATMVFAPARGLRVGLDPGLRTASAHLGTPTPLPAPAAALLAAFDGKRGLADVVATAWGEPEGADQRDLLDQALEQARAFVAAGLLRPNADDGAD